MQKVLVVGENPFAVTGNAKMTRYILTTLDAQRFSIHLFSVDTSVVDPERSMEQPFPFPVTSSLSPGSSELYGRKKLLSLIAAMRFDVVIFVGFDIWQYASIFPYLKKMQGQLGFQWIALFPYDLIDVREDWLQWIRMPDTPMVYSQYGYALLSPRVDHLQYFRPAPPEPVAYHRMDSYEALSCRRRYFPQVPDDAFLFGFVGANQIRKDPVGLLQAFALLLNDSDVLKSGIDIRLVLFTDMQNGKFNLYQNVSDLGIAREKIIARQPGQQFFEKEMAGIYNAFDCLINCSLQEGLSWTVIEAMMCGIPVVASDSTAHKELLCDTGLPLVPCQDQAWIPMPTGYGEGWVEARKCRPEDICLAMKKICLSHSLSMQFAADRGLEKINQWAAQKSDINTAITPKKNRAIRLSSGPKNAVLFAQHSAAGDVLMTTKAMQGLKARHGDLPLVYMTQAKFHEILDGNPYIDEVINWDPFLMENRGRYRFFYAPHNDIVLPGHWGRNCNSLLSDFYWRLIGVSKGEFYIRPKRPESRKIREAILGKRVCVVHTTGGDPHMRTYKYMPEVCRHLKGYVTVQLGGPDDWPAGAELDFRGLLSYRESAWVMAQACLAVTVDSFMSHLAGAMGVSQVCLFGCGNAHVVQPEQVSGRLVCLEPDYLMDCPGLGPCSGQVRDCPVPCMGVHDPAAIVDKLAEIERAIGAHQPVAHPDAEACHG